MRISIKNGRVTDVVVQYETLITGKWHAVVKNDCSYGFFHRDTLFPNGQKEKQVIDFDSLKTALSYSEQDIKDKWEFYKNRYKKGFTTF